MAYEIVKFTDDALQTVLGVPRVFLPLVLKGCVAWAKENGVELKPGIFELLDYMEARGIAAAITSSSPMDAIRKHLSAVNLLHRFRKLCSGHDIPNTKPAPDIYLKVAEDLGVKPENCLVFEDIPNGMRAGKAAGMTVVGVEDESAKKHRAEIDEICDYFIKDYYEVLEGKLEVEYELSSGK